MSKQKPNVSTPPNGREPQDQAARNRIRNELTRSMIVEAGAGSGKTHEMATRMAAGIASGVYEIEHMAAVTFTRKAAAEMRGRFQLALEKKLVETRDDPEREKRLRDALGRIERFFAGTIHAFCARLLRERPVEARVAPGFNELDDAEEMMVRRQSWRDYRAQAKAAGDPNLLALLDAGISPKHLESAFDRMCNFEDVEFPPGDAAEPDGRKAWKALEMFWATLEPMLPVWDPDTTCKLQQRAERFRREWRFASGRGRDGAVLAELLQLWSGQAVVTQNRWPQKSWVAAKQLHADFRESVVLPHLTAWRHYVYRLTVTLLDNARKKAREDRLRRNTLSFNDLLLITADLLRTNESVRRALQQKYRWLFVDEFQDTDPIQAEIMRLLAGSDGALFVVGDPKQSIYRFRRADIDIYNDVRARLAGPNEAGLIKLTTNFRSVPALCAWVNGVFKPLFPSTPTPQSPMFAPLDPHRDSESGPALATITLTGVSDPMEAEASAIARYIRAEVDAGRRKYEDFLILTRKKKALQPYARALETLRVPIEVTGAGAFGESEEVRHLALLLEALADPQDAVSLVGVLRGPLFGLSDRDLFSFRQSGGYFSLFAEIAATDKDALRVADALATLRQWYSWLRMLPAGAALDRIFDASGMLALAATSPDGVEAGDLLHALDRVRAIVERGFTLADAADALAGWSGLDDDGAKESNEVDSLPLEPGRPGVVRLMNLHKAKGLEAKVVFLADPKGGFSKGADVRIVRSPGRTPGGVANGYFRIEKDTGKSYAGMVLAEPEGWDSFATDEQAYLDAEVHRLMYVAATRAQDLLVIGRVAGGEGKNAAWPAFDAHLSGVPELPVPATVRLPAAEDVDLSDKAFDLAVSAAERAHAAAQMPSWTAVSVTSESKAFPRITPGGPDTESHDHDPTRVVTDDTPSRRADAGVEWGTLVHGLLEHAMRHKTATRADLRRLAMWLTMEEPRLRAVIEQALDTVEAVSRSDFWPTARASSEAHEEAPFSVRDDREGVPAILSGTIDLVYRTDNASWRILDYKTDVNTDPAELQRRYAMQLVTYRRAWEKFGGTTVAAVMPTRPAARRSD